MPRELLFSVDSDPQTTRLAFTGEIDLATVDQLREAINGAISTEAPTIEVNMAGVTFLDSTGIRTLVIAHLALDQQGRRLTVTQVRADVMRVLQMTGVDTLLVATSAATATGAP